MDVALGVEMLIAYKSLLNQYQLNETQILPLFFLVLRIFALN